MTPRKLPRQLEIARLLGCSKNTVDALERAGLRKAIKTAHGKRYLLGQVFSVLRRVMPFMGHWPQRQVKGGNLC